MPAILCLLPYSCSPAVSEDAEEQYVLGKQYHLGDGVEQDYTKAYQYFSLVAKQNNEMAQSRLGQMYYNGLGVKQDYNKGMEYFSLVANQADAQTQL